MKKAGTNVSQMAARMVSAYALFSITWLWFSDRALNWLDHPESIINFAFGKGVFFVALTSVALYALISRALHKLTATQAELQRSEDRLRSLFEHMLDGLADCQLIYDDKGQACDYVYLEVNQSYYRLTQQMDVKNKRASEVYPGIEQMHPELLQLFDRVVRSGTPESIEFFFHPRQCWLHFSVFRPGSDAAKFAVIFQDITEKRRRDEEQRARLAVDAASQMKSEFVANVSHEIRTPLNAILGLTFLALQGETDERQRDYLEKIHKAGQGLLALVNDVLDFSKVEEGQLTLESTTFQLDEVLESVSTSLAQTAFDKGLNFVILVDPQVPVWIQGDSLRLGQILTNLVSNAVKFTEAGEVVLEITLVDETLRFSVRDSGIGISETQRKALFKAFIQGDASITRKYGGTGLGLAISQRLAHLMGGEIRAESMPGHGSTFCLEVPQPLPLPPLKEEDQSLKGARVLLVDENPQSAQVLRQILQQVEATVTLQDKAEATEYDYALIHPGPENKVKIADQLAHRAKKRILVVNPGSEAPLSQCPGIDGYLVKPVLRSRLLNALLGKSPDRQAVSEATVPVFEPARILVAEDHPVNQQVIQELLERAGLTVDLANDGQQAVEMLWDAQPGTWKVLLMDLQMPILDGYEATQRIRQEHPPETLPIVALSAHVLPEERQKCLEAGMNDYLAKPIVPEVLFGKLAQWLPASTPSSSLSWFSGPSTNTVDSLAVTQVIRTLNQQMSHFEGAAIDSVDTLVALLKPLGPQPALLQLRKEIERFEFDQGRAALARLCQQLEIEVP